MNSNNWYPHRVGMNRPIDQEHGLGHPPQLLKTLVNTDWASGGEYVGHMKLLRMNSLLTLAALVCFSEIVRAPKDSDPGPLLTAAFGLFLIRRAIMAAPQPIVVILCGLYLAAAAVASNHGIVSSRSLTWLLSVAAAFVCFGFWEKIAGLVRRKENPGRPPR